jgi:hypothetical protein
MYLTQLTTKQAEMEKLLLSTKLRLGGGSRHIAPLILNLMARHIEWSMSCCSQSSHPPQCGNHLISGFQELVLCFEKSLKARAEIQTPDHPAVSLVTCLTTVLPPFKKT